MIASSRLDRFADPVGVANAYTRIGHADGKTVHNGNPRTCEVEMTLGENSANSAVGALE